MIGMYENHLIKNTKSKEILWQGR